MRPLDRRIRTAGAALLLVAGLLAALGAVSSPAGAAGQCPTLPRLTANEWTGNAGDGLWRSDDNWSLGYAPGYADGAIGYACILSDTVRLEGPEDVRKVEALYVGDGANLVVDTGSRLFVRGNPDNQPSTVDKGGTLTVRGATFGGEGRVRLAGTLDWQTDPGGPTATLATRECAVEPLPAGAVARGESCAGADGGHLDGPGGLLVVKKAGVVQVDGGGVALVDGYRLQVLGKVVVAGEGYVVADRGTSTELKRTGEFRIDNDGGYYEGEARFGETELSSFVNDGHLVKVDGDGASAVNATYTQAPDGVIKIKTGTLRVSSGTPIAAKVLPGATYGSGECRKVGGTPDCRPRTDAEDQQNASLRVPLVDRDGAKVVVSELPASPIFAIGRPVEVHADQLDATKRHPAIVTFRLDSSLLAPYQGWQYINVLRDSDAPGGFRRVPRCDADGRPPEGQQACVDRRNKPGVSSRTKRDGDVIMVVRTVGTSRWICR
ncbi:MAG TPA: hypothetical protein VNS55_10080 [Nocardioides sp.]|nr:hypothetical protein [Nocardioides sp.]